MSTDLSSIPGTITRWATQSNRRRLGGLTAALLLAMAAALVLAAGLVLPGCAAPGRDAAELSLQSLSLDHAGPPTLPRHAVWLEQLDLAGVDQEWGAARRGLSVDGHALSIGGRVFKHGVGTHAESEMIVLLSGGATAFRALVGVDDEVGELGTVTFAVWVDGEERYRSDVLHGGDPADLVAVDLTGAQQMMLVVEDGGDNINYDHADWASAMILLEPRAKEQPAMLVQPAGPPPELASGFAAAPAIHAPRITGSTPGRAFLFRIPATGDGPLSFEAEGLPAGLTLDAETGIITGSLTSEGTTDVRVRVTGPAGATESTLTIVGGEHQLALTPPMGWNSWNVWGTAVDDAKVRSAADWMERSGLAAVGYRYINIDDAWEGERDEAGRLQTNDKFPDMKALADYVHSKGLKLGIYSSPGPKTCAGYEGSYGYEEIDAQTWADWGIDLVKYDWCSYQQIATDDSRPEMRKPYEVMRAALDAVDHDIVFSLCQYGRDRVWEWGEEVGGNYWRTTGDIWDSWSSMSRIGFGQAGLEEYAGPGHWNDPDMLVVGMVGWGPSLHPTRLTPNEQVTHITLWSLLASPLLIGCDMSQLDEFTLSLLANPEVLAVNQDPLGRQAGRVLVDGRLEVWARPLSDGTQAVGLFNRGRSEATITVSFADLGLAGLQPVRNLWQRADEGEFMDCYSARVAGHGAVMLKIGAPAE